MQDIEQLLQKTKIVALYEKKEEEWSLLNEKVKVLEADIDAINEGRDMIDKKNLLLKTQPIIQNPLLMRNNSNTEQKKLIVSVRFGDSLMRDKKNGLRTLEKPMLYNILRDLHLNDTLKCPRGDSNP